MGSRDWGVTTGVGDGTWYALRVDKLPLGRTNSGILFLILFIKTDVYSSNVFSRCFTSISVDLVLSNNHYTEKYRTL